MNPGKTFQESRRAQPLSSVDCSRPPDPSRRRGIRGARGIRTATATGTQVTMSVPFARESIDEILARAPLRTRRSPETGPSRFIEFQGDPVRRDKPGRRRPDRPLPPRSPVVSRPLGAGADINFTGLGNPPAGQDVIPPDTMGAAGPNHLVSLLNSDFGVFDKSRAPAPDN